MEITIADYTSAGTTHGVADLLLKIGEGNPAAWGEILHRYGKLVRARVRPFRLQEADALDAVQMTWLRLAENCHRIRDPERLAGWLATTVRRECLRILRQAKYTADFAEGAEDVVDPLADPEQQVIDVETMRVLRNLVAELSLRQRTLMRALFVDDPKPYAEVACSIGIPPGSIGPTRARALKQLRWMLDERGLGPRA